MDANTSSKINQMIYHISNGDSAAADKVLKNIVNSKVQNIYNAEYAVLANKMNMQNSSEKN